MAEAAISKINRLPDMGLGACGRTTYGDDQAIQGHINALLAGDHGNPFVFLGLHASGSEQSCVYRTFQPGADRVELTRGSNDEAIPLTQIHETGVFAAQCNEPLQRPVTVKVWYGSDCIERVDPYTFPPLVSDYDIHLHAEGTHLRAYEFMGAHPRTVGGIDGTHFVVWAPNARRVSVIGPFCDWDGCRLPMRKRVECGLWEIFVPEVARGSLYKFEIKGEDGSVVQRSDPYALETEVRPRTAAIVSDLGGASHREEQWQQTRRKLNDIRSPLSIYEVHLGSWRRVPEEGDRFLTYRELADQLVAYAKDMGFTHLELLPIQEHPFDGSWGYQPLNLFAPTSRFGSPEDFSYFVTQCHEAGLGLIMDWVPGHFPDDPHGLVQFDGTALYEHIDERQGRHHEWGTLVYNYARSEVVNFLLSNATYWLDRYGVDGLRVDAVAAMLYLDYNREDGEWLPNEFGGRENLDAVSFLKRLNEAVFADPERGSTTMAEESTAWPMVSRPTYLGGLGFGYKWNMGWMNDTLRYMALDPIHRRYHQDLLTFGLLYAFTENFVLPLSHDEVVHGKGSLLSKMPGDTWQKFANLRLYLAFQFTQPGKKLLFMGGEFGQEREWTHDTSLDWHLLSQPLHSGLQKLVKDLNHTYRTVAALHEGDCEEWGFRWIDCHDVENSVISYLRLDENSQSHAVIVCNFTPVVRSNYRIGVPFLSQYREIINTDAADYGGSGIGNCGSVQADSVAIHGNAQSLSLTLPPLAALVLVPHQ